MFIAKGTKVKVGNSQVVLSQETGYYQLIEQVERIYPILKVVGFRFISKDTMVLLTTEKEGDSVVIPKGTTVSFVANGELQKYELEMNATIDMVEESILEWFEGYREESLCFNGINYMFPNIASGYAIIEGKMAERFEEENKKTYFSMKDVKNVLTLGVRKGDTLHLKGYSSFKVSSVDFGNNMICLSLE
jgi:hypothetical protein